MNERVTALEMRLGIRLADEKAALAALTHKSYVNEHREEELADNQRLEFLGDAVIDLAISHRLMALHPQAQEGVLTRLRAGLVSEEGLARVARHISLGELLLLGKGEERTGGRERSSTLADALEAVLAVVFLGGGLAQVLEVVDRIFGPWLGEAGAPIPDSDFKSQLQELAQGRLQITPRYRVLEERGPDHARTFFVAVHLAGERYGSGEGRSKKEAEQLAAQEALEALEQVLAEGRTVLARSGQGGEGEPDAS